MILPIDAHLAAAVAAVRERGALVLTAAPGAGKSTRLPPALLPVVRGQVLLLQPRRIAARTLARRIADERGGRLGDEVGYQVRFDKVGGERTRLWVLTEGLLSRRLQSDPLLEGVGAVVLDEFHERSIHTDLVLAHLAELRRGLRPDLVVVVMSATLDPGPVAGFLGDCPVIDVPAPVFPVTIRHQPMDRQTRLEEAVAAAVVQALAADDHGDVLVFLPGAGEIRACQARLYDLPGLTVLPLHGGLPADEQDRALVPAPDGTTKIVLATNVAETSLTIPGIRTVIDSGLVRIDRFDPERGLDQLVLEDCSKASATQRAGRAGRTAPGRCWKLWSQAAEVRRSPATDPEVHRVDLAPTLLLLKGWHGADPRSFPWFDPPAADRLDHGEDLLALLGATAAPWTALTAVGERLARLPVHPRLGRLLLSAADAGQPNFGATVAALIEGRDLRLREAPGSAQPGAGDADVLDRIDRLERAERQRFDPSLRSQGIDPIAAREAARIRDDLQRMVAGSSAGSAERQLGNNDSFLPRLLLSAFPDRVGRRSAPGANRGMLTGGIAVEIDPASCLTNRPGERKSELFCATVSKG